MGLYKGTTRYANIVTVDSGEEPVLETLTINKNGTYSPSEGIDGFSKANADVPSIILYNSPYVDENGKFIKPDEWDDIESIELDANAQEVYYLYDNTRELSFCSIKVTTSGSNSFCDYGRVRNGVFEVITTETKSSGSAYQRCLSNDFPNEDYIVLRFRPTTGRNLTKLELSNWTYNSRALAGAFQPLLMRYGNMPFAQAIPCAIYSLVSDNIMNCKTLTTLASVYNGCVSLVRHRHTGWDTTNVTSVTTMFNNCYSLIDCDTDFSNWISGGKCTTIASFMYACYSLMGTVNISGWNTSNVTAVSGMFYNCYCLTKVIGLEDLYLPKATSISSFFYNCYSLYQNEQGKLDLTKWQFAKDVTANISFATVFQNCRYLKEIDISNWNMTRATSLSSICNTCYLLEKIYLPNNVGSAELLTTTATAFINCYRLKEIDLSKINFSKVTSLNTMLNNDYCLETVIPPTTTPAGGSASSSLTTLMNYAYLIENLDMSWLDCSKFTNASSQFNDMFKYCLKLKNFIPPININNGFKVDFCPNLSRESLLAIINNLSQLSATKTVALGTVNLAKLTADEIAIATGKGWTVA